MAINLTLLFIFIFGKVTTSEDETLPYLGFKKGVSMWDYEKIPFFKSAGGQQTCTMRVCEGVDPFAALQRDISPWKARGGISVLKTFPIFIPFALLCWCYQQLLNTH